MSNETKSVSQNYPKGECPDCQEVIPADASDGAECANCGHVFFEVREAAHTPTPYIAKHEVGESRISPKWGQFCMATFYSDNHEGDSDFIVRACNAHDDLLAACKAVRDNWEGNLTEAMALVNAAIEKAGHV